MESKEYDVARNPVVQNEVFFLQSKPVKCRCIERKHERRCVELQNCEDA